MPKTEPVISDFEDRGLATLKHYLPLFEIVMGLLIILVIILGIYFSNNNKKTPVVATSSEGTTVCTNSTNLPTLQTAVKDISKNNMSALKTQVNNIKAIPNYKSDPNCLYPIVYYYINTSDGPNATKYLAELKAVYKNNYSQYLGKTLYLSNMEKDVENIQSISQQNLKNDYTITPPAGINQK